MRIVLLFFINGVFAGNILVFNPALGHSHVRFLGNLADILEEDGHNVTILSPIMDETVGLHGTENPRIHKITWRSPYLNQTFWERLAVKSSVFWTLPEQDGQITDWTMWEAFMDAFQLIYKGLLEDKDLLKILQDSKFDIGLTEIFEIGNLGIFEIIGIKTAMAAASLGLTSYHYEVTGLPNFLSFVPSWIMNSGDEMSFIERLRHIQADYEMRCHDLYDRKRNKKLFREYYPEFPDFLDLAEKKVGVIFVNSNEFTETPRPRTTMFQYVGGTNVHMPKPLSTEIESILSQRPSAVFFSFGSFIKACQMPVELKTEILQAFQSFPGVTFLWKYEDCEEDDINFSEYPNVVAKNWWPQSDLLADDRVKAFITHAGMNSMLEVSYRGKPSITIPLFADQYVNAKAAQRMGISTMIRRTELSKETLMKALGKVLDNESPLVAKAHIASQVLEGRQVEYKKEVKRWTRLLLNFGPLPHNILSSKKIYWFQLYNLDCYALILSVPLFLGYLIVKICGVLSKVK